MHPLRTFSQCRVMDRAGSPSSSVEGISQNGMAEGGEMHPDLVCSASLGKDLKERGAVEFLKLPPSGDRFPSPFRSGGHPLSLGRVSSDGRID